MARIGRQSRHHWEQAFQVISRILFIIAGAFIHIRVALFIISGAHRDEWLLLFAGSALYMLSQAVRAARLIVIVGDPRVSIKRLACAHLIGAAASFILPFKIGDLLRLNEVAHVLKWPAETGLWRAFSVMWIERVYDAAMVTVFLGLVSLSTASADGATILPIIIALALFVIGTTLVLFILPENLDDLALFIARRYAGGGAIRVLRYISRVHGLISEVRRLLRYKQVTILGLSAAIWGLEAAVAAIIIRSGIGGSIEILLSFLSGTMSSASTQKFNIPEYAWAIGAPLLVVGLIAWYAQLLLGRFDGSVRQPTKRTVLGSA